MKYVSIFICLYIADKCAIYLKNIRRYINLFQTDSFLYFYILQNGCGIFLGFLHNLYNYTIHTTYNKTRNGMYQRSIKLNNKLNLLHVATLICCRYIIVILYDHRLPIDKVIFMLSIKSGYHIVSPTISILHVW